MTAKLTIQDQDVLLVVDIQNDFCPGGGLAVPRGDEVVSLVNRLATRFKHVVLTQDWHPPGHLSFASAHRGRKRYEIVSISMARKSFGRIIACKQHRAPNSAGTCRL